MRLRTHLLTAALPLLSAIIALGSCNDAGFAVVSISPIYGYVDGCTDVKVSGHGFSENAEALLDDITLENLAYPDPNTNELDEGFIIYGRTPRHEKGYVDLIVVNKDLSYSTLKEAYYYVDCPGEPWLDSISPSAGVLPHDVVTLSGCNIDTSEVFVRVNNSEPIPLSPSCRTATSTFMAPELPAGDYELALVDAKGALLWPSEPCSAKDTAGECQEPLVLNYGGEK